MYIEVNGLKINYQIIGRGQPILLVHGWGGSQQSMQPLANLLQNKFQVITLDLPGFGESTNPPQSWGVEGYSQFIVTFIDRLKLNKVIYFGHSFGGSLGIYVAANHSDVLKRLILCNTSFERIKPVSPLAKRISFLPDWLKIILYKVFYPASDISRYPHLMQNFKKIMQQDLAYLFPKITTQTQIIWGQDDKITPVRMAKVLAASISRSKLAIVPGEGHGLPLKSPQKVVDIILNNA